MQVIKRNGEKQPFDFSKIKNAVNKAFNAVHQSDAPDEFINFLEAVASTFNSDMTVEDIQNSVEYALMGQGWYDVAKAYIIYRDAHAIERERRKRIQYMKDYQLNGENAATSSASDPNANMNLKNVANMESEVYKLK